MVGLTAATLVGNDNERLRLAGNFFQPTFIRISYAVGAANFETASLRILGLQNLHKMIHETFFSALVALFIGLARDKTRVSRIVSFHLNCEPEVDAIDGQKNPESN